MYPSTHSVSRLKLAQSMIPTFMDNDNIAAVMVGGSVGRGCADEYSDLEIGLVWEAEVAPEDKLRLLNKIGTPDFDDTVFISGNSMNDAFKVDIIHTTLSEIHQALEDKGNFEELRGFLGASIPIYNLPEVKKWQRDLRNQFEADWFNQLQNNLNRLVDGWREVANISPNEFIMCRNRQINIIVDLIHTICKAHHEEANSKWIQWSLDKVGPYFKDLPKRLFPVSECDPVPGFDILRGICLESLDFVEDLQPDICWDSARKVIAETSLSKSVIAPITIEQCSVSEATNLLSEKLDMPWFALNRAIFYAKRQALCIFWRMMEEYGEFVLQTLSITNCLKPPAESDPYCTHLLPHLNISPPNFEHRLKQAFFLPLSDALEQMHDLIEDTFDLVNEIMPGVDITQSRHHFRNDRRKPWLEVPSLPTA